MGSGSREFNIEQGNVGGVRMQRSAKDRIRESSDESMKCFTKRTDGYNLRRIGADDGGDLLGEGEDIVELIVLESSVSIGGGKCEICVVSVVGFGECQTTDGKVQIREELLIDRLLNVRILKCIVRIRRRRRDRR